MMTKNSKLDFDSQKHSAKDRGIPFTLTYEEWLSLWTGSGHLAERGRRRGQYVMARFGDTGPYSVDNVKIVKAEENVREGNCGKTISIEQRLKISESNRRRARPVGKKNPMFGRTHTAEARAKISAARLGKKLSAEHCAKISAGGLGKKHHRKKAKRK